jgi:hypothetical protein
MKDATFETIPAGTLVFVTIGDYSDYRIAGHFRLTCDITAEMIDSLQDHLAEEMRANPIFMKQYRHNNYIGRSRLEDKALPEMCRRGWLDEIEAKELHLATIASDARQDLRRRAILDRP